MIKRSRQSPATRGLLVLLLSLWLGVVVTVGTPRSASGQAGWLLIAPPWDAELMAQFASYMKLVRTVPPEQQEDVAEQMGLKRQVMRRLSLAFKPGTGAGPATRISAALAEMRDTAAPLSRWQQVSAFDSAQACERSLSDMRALTPAPHDDGASLNLSEDTVSALLDLVSRHVGVRKMRCVPTTAVYGQPPR